MRLWVARNVWADGPKHLIEFPMVQCGAVTTNLSLSSERGLETAEKGLDLRSPEVGNGDDSAGVD